MRNIAMLVSYEGTAYHGFQIQPERVTVQQRLVEAIFKLTGEKAHLHGSGRTDAGVHARGQVISFQTGSTIPTDRWPAAMNTELPSDISIVAAQEVPLAFHARKQARRKTYRYYIQNGRIPNVFLPYVFHYPRPLDVERMHAAAQLLTGEHDFTSFCSRKSDKASHIRTIYRADCVWKPSPFDLSGKSEQIEFSITGNGFLYNMVRIIVSTLIQVGDGRKSPEDLLFILQQRDRTLAGPTAPAKGLFLWEVQYDELHFDI
ncbi:tRNA pseudouridine(38-40) synthase TruA [Marinicrinis sediminis]|uniref:tRNA pseudouridine synthase A n=1 Tax=Marinicrinis sediminis TaxID=1652465 RepID=A0ABW5RCK3_9BACL